METTSLVIGIAAGIALGYVMFQLLMKGKHVSETGLDELTTKFNQADSQNKHLADKLSTLEALKNSIAQKLEAKEEEATRLTTKAALLEEKLSNSEGKVGEITQQLASEQTTTRNLQDEVNSSKQKIAELTVHNNSLSENLQKQNALTDKQVKQIEDLTQKTTELSAQVSHLAANNAALNEKLESQKTEVQELQKTAHLQFEKIANRLLEEKSEKFTHTNKTTLETLLNPLKEDITRFKEKVEATHTEETKQRTSLEERIKGLIEQTNKVSEEANNLASALKGKAQKRGNWGEMILERILETSGLTKDREYFIQHTIKDEEGKNQRLDVRVNLPDDRAIIIDSKVSLIAYDNYAASEDGEQQKKFISDHITATKVHIDQLSQKKYDNLDTTLDFTMMFVPIEPAYLLAIQNDPDLWAYAYSKRILLVSPTTLIACLKLFSDLWRREWQNKNAMEIVKRGESLYEKFVGFSKSFEDIGKSIESSQEIYAKALGQFNKGKGNLVSQAIQLHNLGLKSEKKISANLLTTSSDIETNETEDTDEA